MTSAGKWVLGLLLLVVGAVFVARTISSEPGSQAQVKLPAAESAGASKESAAAKAAAAKKAAAAPAIDLACKKACVEVHEVANDSVTTAKLAPGSVTLSKLAFEVPNLNELVNEINARRAAEASAKAAIAEAAAATAQNDAAISAAAANGLSVEAAARTAAIEKLAKEGAAADAGLLTKMNEEITNRGAADDVLQGKLNSEIAERAGAIANLRSELGNPNQVDAPIVQINNNEIVADAVTTDKILDRTILAQDLGIGSVTTDEILDGTIRGADVTTDDALALTGANIKDNSLTTDDLGTGSVDNDELAGDAVTTDKISNRTIKSEDLEENAITSFELANNSVDTAAIQDGAITNGKLRSAAGTEAVDTNVIRNGAVTNAKLDSTIGSEAVDTNVIKDQAVTGAKIAPLTITAANLQGNDKDNGLLSQDRAVSAKALADDAVTNRTIADGALALAKLEVDIATQSELEDATTGAASPLNTFKRELSNTGTFNEGGASKPNDPTDPVSFNKVKDIDPDILLKKAADVVCSECVDDTDIKKVAGSKVEGNIAAGQINGALTSATIDAGAITGTVTAAGLSWCAGCVDLDDLAAGSVKGRALGGDEIVQNSIAGGSAGDIALGTITGQEPPSGTETLSGNIALGTITAANLAPAAALNNLAPGSINTLKLADGAVTTDKQTANFAVSPLNAPAITVPAATSATGGSDASTVAKIRARGTDTAQEHVVQLNGQLQAMSSSPEVLTVEWRIFDITDSTTPVPVSPVYHGQLSPSNPTLAGSISQILPTASPLAAGPKESVERTYALRITATAPAASLAADRTVTVTNAVLTVVDLGRVPPPPSP